MDNIEVRMLIGANCMKALESIEIISSRNGGLYAYKTKLGWCIVGPITSRNDGSVKCHRIAVKDVASGKKSPHHFVLHNKPKKEDVSIKKCWSKCIIVTSVNVNICKSIVFLAT